MDEPVIQRRVPAPIEVQPQQPFVKRMRRIDLFPKPKEDFQREQSKGGALVSLGATALISILLVWECGAYIAGRDAYSSELVVMDSSFDSDTNLARVPVNIDITFPSIQCHNLWLDVLDVSDGFEEEAVQDLIKSPVSSWGYLSFSQKYDFAAQQHALAGMLEAKRSKALNNEFDDQLRAHGDNQRGGGGEMQGQRIGNMIIYMPQRDVQHKDYCGHCYVDRHLGTSKHAKDAKCCNTCMSVMDAFDTHGLKRPNPSTVEQCLFEESKKNPGCNIKGTFLVKRVKGNFHFRPGIGSFGLFGEHTHDYDMAEAMRYNVSHDIHHLSFGAPARRFTSTHSSESGITAFPLDKKSFRTRFPLESVIYLLNVVPATYTTTFRGTDSSFEFSAQHQKRPPGNGNRIQGMGLTFQFDFYNMQLNNRFLRPSLSHFIVQLCGIVGGLFVVMSFVDTGVSYWLELKKSVV